MPIRYFLRIFPKTQLSVSGEDIRDLTDDASEAYAE